MKNCDFHKRESRQALKCVLIYIWEKEKSREILIHEWRKGNIDCETSDFIFFFKPINLTKRRKKLYLMGIIVFWITLSQKYTVSVAQSLKICVYYQQKSIFRSAFFFFWSIWEGDWNKEKAWTSLPVLCVISSHYKEMGVST